MAVAMLHQVVLPCLWSIGLRDERLPTDKALALQAWFAAYR